MAKSLLLTPGPIHVPDPGAHIKSNATEIAYIKIWEISTMQLLRYEQSKRFNANL